MILIFEFKIFNNYIDNRNVMLNPIKSSNSVKIGLQLKKINGKNNIHHCIKFAIIIRNKNDKTKYYINCNY